MPTVSLWFCHVEIFRNVRQRHWHWHATQEMRRKWGDVGPGLPRSVLTPAHVILTSIRNNNRPDPEIFTAPCPGVSVNWPSPVDHQKLTRGPGRFGTGLWWTGGWIIDWETSFSHPWPHATAGENVEISSFLIFYKYSARREDQSYLSSSEGLRLGLRVRFSPN